MTSVTRSALFPSCFASLLAITLALPVTALGQDTPADPEPAVDPEPAPAPEPDPEPAPVPEPEPEPTGEGAEEAQAEPVQEPPVEMVPEPGAQGISGLVQELDGEGVEPEGEPLPLPFQERPEHRGFLMADWGVGGLSLSDQFERVFDSGGVAVGFRVGGGVDNAALAFSFDLGSLSTPVYSPLSLISVGLEGRYYVPLDEGVDGLRVWGIAGFGAAWTTGCTESEDNDCEPEGDPIITTYSGFRTTLGAGVGWFFGEGVLGVFGDVRRASHWLDSEDLGRHIRGDVWVFTFGVINELGWP